MSSDEISNYHNMFNSKYYFRRHFRYDFYGDIQRWWVGTVEEGSGQTDPNGLGRCRVRIDGIHGPDISLDDLPYAQTVTSCYRRWYIWYR